MGRDGDPGRGRGGPRSPRRLTEYRIIDPIPRLTKAAFCLSERHWDGAVVGLVAG